MPVLITGAMGNIGRRLMTALPDAVGLDIRPGSDFTADLAEADFFVAPLFDMLTSVDAVIHLATSADPDAPPPVHFEAVAITALLVMACTHAGVPRLVLPSSDWAEPKDPALQSNAYGHSKRAIEAMAEMYTRMPGRRAVALRYGWVPGDRTEVETAPDWLKTSYWPDSRLIAEVEAALRL